MTHITKEFDDDWDAAFDFAFHVAFLTGLHGYVERHVEGWVVLLKD